MKIVSTNKLLNYQDFLRYGNTFIETGTAAGDGVQRALNAGFKHIHSIEASDHWYEICFERFRLDPKASIHFGLSTDVLKAHPHLFFETKSPIFFLDAHPSGPTSAGHSDLMQKGEQSEFNQDTILTREIDIILELADQPIIMIDDQHGLDLYSQRYMDTIYRKHPNYIFEFYDENIGGNNFYKDKVLVARYE